LHCHKRHFIDQVERAPRLLALLAAISVIASCGGDDGTINSGSGSGSPTYSAGSGLAQKGPLQQGSTVTAQELNSVLSPTGKQYSYQITSDLGMFTPTSAFTSQYVGLIATGYYFDEVTGSVSDGPVTLNAYSDLSTAAALNVNLLTTLAYQRIQRLVSSGMTFSAATTQAENEVLAAFGIQNGSSYGPFGTLDLSQDTDGDNILATLSSLFVSGNTPGNVSALIANFQGDLGTNGVITNQTTATALAASAKALNDYGVASNLSTKYASSGATFTAMDINNWLDRDGDGVVGKFEFQLRNATPTSTFTFPSFVTHTYAGSRISISTGQLSINGSPVAGPVTIAESDVLSASPAGNFPDNVLTAYLMKDSTKAAKISFVSPTGSTNTWIPAAPTLKPRSDHAATVLQNGKVLVTGGGTSLPNSTLSDVEIYDPNTNTWTPAASMAHARRSHTATLLPNGTVLVLGGDDSSSAEIYDPAANTWTAAANLPPNRRANAAVLLQSGLVLVIGGSVSGDTALPNAALYDPVANTWSVTGNTWTPRGYGFTATLLPNGKVFVMGGYPPGSAPYSAEIYDPASNTWSRALSALSIPLVYHTATLLQNGKVLIDGGSVYDPATNTLSAIAIEGSSASGSLSMTALPNGKVLLAGISPVSYRLSTALYDPVANLMSPAPSPINSRTRHTAVLLPSGAALIIGGTTASGNTTASCEMYQ
jgi:hypothetical protein